MKNSGSAIFIYLCLIASSTGQDWKLVFEDTFDKLDPNKWDHEVTMWGGGNGEFQAYTPDDTNTYVKNNTLYIKPTLTKDNLNPLTGKPFGEAFLYNGTWNLTEMYGRCTMGDNYGCFREGQNGILPPTMSGRIRSKGRFSFKYGRVEVEAKMPAGDWMWPAIWFLPENEVYGGWPRSGEIDLLESRGNRNLKSNGDFIGIQRVGSALHWGPRWNVNKYSLTNDVKSNSSYNFGDYFHKYELEWDTNGMRFIVDGDEYTTFPNPLINENPAWKGFWDYGMNNGGMGGLENPWVNRTLISPFDQEFHILLNVAIGGTNGYFPDDVVSNDNETKPWNNTGSSNKMEDFWNARDNWATTWEGENGALQIKSIRVYQIDDPPSTTNDPPSTTDDPPSTKGNTAFVMQCSVTMIVAMLVIFLTALVDGNLL